ncbi:MAG: HAMP domain-containing protein [Betaproteobacteria bacterium]|nr:HAMP domain-containing protein [Betaproteobacteria bacterium]NBY05105.1 HAMP domain-containing protein [Betaproteobacteria bacterium]
MRVLRSVGSRTFVFFIACSLVFIFGINRMWAGYFSQRIHQTLWDQEITQALWLEVVDLADPIDMPQLQRSLLKRIAYSQVADLRLDRQDEVNENPAKPFIWGATGTDSLEWVEQAGLNPMAKARHVHWSFEGHHWTWVSLHHRQQHYQMLLDHRVAQQSLARMWAVRDQTIWYQLPTVVLSAVLLAWLVTRLMLNPMQRLSQRLNQIVRLQPQERIDAKGSLKEFESLINAFNALLDRLQISYQQASRFSSDAAHELQTPLTILRGQLAQAINQAGDYHDVQIRLTSISDEVERLISITEKLLQLSLADAGRMSLVLEPIPLSDWVAELVDDAASFAPHLKTSWQGDPHVIWHADRNLARQLLTNLLSNAVKYNQVGGWIRFYLKQTDQDVELEIHNPTEADLQGMEEKLFERFYRLDPHHNRKTGGSGLGLSLCREIAKAHGGALTMGIKPQKNVVMRLRLPLQQSHTV